MTERIRVLIWGKTYPELSRRYAETVCTAGVREDGTPIRLYPVPIRYLSEEKQYGLWEWVEVDVTKAVDDSRPESFKINPASLAVVGSVPPDRQEWSGRREHLFRNDRWHYENTGALKAAERTGGHSLGLVQPGEISRVYLRQKPAEAAAEYAQKLREVQDQRDLFLPEYKKLAFRTHEIRMQWRCAPRCDECTTSPHDMQVLDWGLIELARKRDWDWEAARSKLEEIASLERYDFRLFLGNMKAHRTSFTIVGLWYPKRRQQMNLL